MGILQVIFVTYNNTMHYLNSLISNPKQSLIGCLMIFSMMNFSACKTPGLVVKTPGCVEDKIREILESPPTNPRTEVWLWELENQIWYYFNAPCCDQFSTLYDQECKKVCAPDGGFTGKGDGLCPPGLDKAKKTIIWKDQR